MNIKRITDATPTCFGVCCEKHADCARYANTDGSWTDRIAECGEGRTLFVPLRPAERDEALGGGIRLTSRDVLGL